MFQEKENCLQVLTCCFFLALKFPVNNCNTFLITLFITCVAEVAACNRMAIQPTPFLMFQYSSITSLLCIMTTKQVLHVPVTGQNHVFWCFNNGKRKNSTQKIRKGVYQHLGVTLKCWLTCKSGSTPGENIIFLIVALPN